MKIALLEHNFERAALIKVAIQESGLKKTHIADLMGVTRQAVNGWITHGGIQLSKLQELEKILNRSLMDKNQIEATVQVMLNLMAKTDERGKEKMLIAAKDTLEAHEAWRNSLPKPFDDVADFAKRRASELLSGVIDSEISDTHTDHLPPGAPSRTPGQTDQQ